MRKEMVFLFLYTQSTHYVNTNETFISLFSKIDIFCAAFKSAYYLQTLRSRYFSQALETSNVIMDKPCPKVKANNSNKNIDYGVKDKPIRNSSNGILSRIQHNEKSVEMAQKRMNTLKNENIQSTILNKNGKYIFHFYIHV